MSPRAPPRLPATPEQGAGGPPGAPHAGPSAPSPSSSCGFVTLRGDEATSPVRTGTGAARRHFCSVGWQGGPGHLWAQGTGGLTDVFSGADYCVAPGLVAWQHAALPRQGSARGLPRGSRVPHWAPQKQHPRVPRNLDAHVTGISTHCKH